MSSEVLVAGVGMTKFAKPGQNAPYTEMGAAALRDALADGRNVGRGAERDSRAGGGVEDRDALAVSDGDVRAAGVHAFLVGEAFMRAKDPGAELQRLFTSTG